jgi:hypothetical protein
MEGKSRLPFATSTSSLVLFYEKFPFHQFLMKTPTKPNNMENHHTTSGAHYALQLDLCQASLSPFNIAIIKMVVRCCFVRSFAALEYKARYVLHEDRRGGKVE